MSEKMYEQLKQEIAEIQKKLTVPVKNGEVKQKPVNEVLADVLDIIEPLKDLRKLVYLIKKYKKLSGIGTGLGIAGVLNAFTNGGIGELVVYLLGKLGG